MEVNFESGVLLKNSVLANTHTGYRPYLVGHQEALAGGTGSHKNMHERERAIEWGSCGDRALAEPTQHYLN